MPPPPGDATSGADHCTEQHEQPGRVETDLVDVVGVAVNLMLVAGHQVADQHADECLRVPQALGEQPPFALEAAVAPSLAESARLV